MGVRTLQQHSTILRFQGSGPATAASTHGVHRRKRQCQPGQACRGGSQHIAQIMRTQVYAAEADQQNHDERAEDCPHAQAPGFE